MITGYASETSVTPGQSFHLHVAAPPGSRYRVLVYRLGWYRGGGGRLIMCVPGCRSAQAAIAQPPPARPASVTGLVRAPLHHRLVFAIGHDEYWTQRMRDAFNRALALSTNLMFGSDSADWRMRYAAGRRTIVEWRDPSIDPVHNRRLDNGFFSTFGEPECNLMGVQHQWAAQRSLTTPPTSYTVVGPSSDPWLTAAGLVPGDVVPGVVGYEWDSLIPGCFAGQVVPLMTARMPGSDGVSHSADMVRATAPSGGRVFAMGTMELAWALDKPDGRSPSPQLVAFIRAALRDLTRPAPPAAALRCVVAADVASPASEFPSGAARHRRPTSRFAFRLFLASWRHFHH